MDVGKRIKARRKEIGMSAEEVAAIIGVSPATVYRYESANIMNMKTDKLLPIAEALNTTPAYLMGWTDDPANNNTDSSLAIHSRTRDISDQATSKCAIVHNNHRASISWALPLANAYAIAVEPTQRNVCKLLDIGHVIPDTLAIPYQREMIVYNYPAAAGLPLYAESDFERIGFFDDDVPHGADFGIRISGDSMEPTIEDGSIVWVHKQGDIRDGEIGIFMLADSAVCKRARLKNGNGNNIKRLESDNPAYKPIVGGDLEGLRVVGKVLL